MSDAPQITSADPSVAEMEELIRRRLSDRVDNDFVHHAPTEGQPEIYNMIREHGRVMARFLINTVPGSRELSVALTHLDEVIFWANAALARNPITKEEPA